MKFPPLLHSTVPSPLPSPDIQISALFNRQTDQDPYLYKTTGRLKLWFCIILKSPAISITQSTAIQLECLLNIQAIELFFVWHCTFQNSRHY